MFDKKQRNDKFVRKAIATNHNQTVVLVAQSVRKAIAINHNQTVALVVQPVRKAIAINHNQTLVRSS